MLTASHDNVTAWAGIGAAVIQLWHQRTAPARASILDVFSAALYLSTIVGLHITASSLFSLGASSSLRTSVAGTRGLPAFNGVPDVFAFQNLQLYAIGSLYFLPSIDSVASPGLQDGTLYDVLNNDVVTAGNATSAVSATGFKAVDTWRT
ncbi:hypothetical protein B0H19DRAFT_1277478 [Mycena capillaripes]|nr:hypothetical protein B0H19DRAFT_1277478 [Mycena capillaripes]